MNKVFGGFSMFINVLCIVVSVANNDTFWITAGVVGLLLSAMIMLAEPEDY